MTASARGIISLSQTLSHSPFLIHFHSASFFFTVAQPLTLGHLSAQLIQALISICSGATRGSLNLRVGGLICTLSVMILVMFLKKKKNRQVVINHALSYFKLFLSHMHMHTHAVGGLLQMLLVYCVNSRCGVGRRGFPSRQKNSSTFWTNSASLLLHKPSYKVIGAFSAGLCVIFFPLWCSVLISPFALLLTAHISSKHMTFSFTPGLCFCSPVRYLFLPGYVILTFWMVVSIMPPTSVPGEQWRSHKGSGA